MLVIILACKVQCNSINIVGFYNSEGQDFKPHQEPLILWVDFFILYILNHFLGSSAMPCGIRQGGDFQQTAQSTAKLP